MNKDGNVMIKVQNLTKKYGSNLALDNVSFSVKSGEIAGFLGPNGAGKTTTMNILTGYLSSTSGTVTIDGFDKHIDGVILSLFDPVIQKISHYFGLLYI